MEPSRNTFHCHCLDNVYVTIQPELKATRINSSNKHCISAGKRKHSQQDGEYCMTVLMDLMV